MGTFVVNLPNDLKPFVDSQVAAGNYESADEFVQTLISEAILRRNRAHVEEMLEEGLLSESVPWTKQDVEDIKREVMQRAERNRGAGR